MKPEDIEQMKRDREDGTPGPWVVHNCESSGDRCTHFYQEIWNDDTDILVTTEVTRAHKDGGSANMRRIARVPDLEAEVLRLREALEWQPRETMPDDETKVLMWHRRMGADVHPASRVFAGVTHWKRILPPAEPSEGESP